MSSTANMLMEYLKNIEAEWTKKSYTYFSNTISAIVKTRSTNSNNKPSINHPTVSLHSNTDDLIRNGWKKRSIVEIYSREQQKWHEGEIIEIFNDKEGEWLNVKYAQVKIKEIQRFSHCIRPKSKNKTNQKDTKNKTNHSIANQTNQANQRNHKKEPLLSIEHIRQKIFHLLKTYAPQTAISIHDLMKEWKNKEHELLYSLCIKYKEKYTKIAPKTLKNTYRIGPKIGSGAFASVRKCKRKSDGMLFAIKIIEKSKYKNDTQLLLLQNEINTMRTLCHPNVIQLYDVFENDKQICLILDLCKGGGIFETIVQNNGKGFKESDAKLIFYHLCLALQYIHSKYVVHRDLKIEDLLFRKKEKLASTITITDFGLCGNCKHNDGFLTDSVGTPNYVSPEIVNKHKYNTQIDMWSIGVILYILLSGKQPFHILKDEHAFKLYELIKKAKYEPMTSVEWFGVSDTAKDLIQQLLQINPKKRFSANRALRHPWLNFITLIYGYVRTNQKGNNHFFVSYSTEIIARYF